jgi:predicted nuclease with TOPRIM domain
MCGGQIKKFTLEPAGQKVVELQAEVRRLWEELRIREESQIPVIPLAAQKRLEAAEAEAGRLREQLDARTQDISDTEKRWGETLAERGRLREQLDAIGELHKVEVARRHKPIAWWRERYGDEWVAASGKARRELDEAIRAALEGNEVQAQD